VLGHSRERAIVLAGGEGVRLRPLVRELCGDERPKQFAKIVESKSLLSHTLDRVALMILPEQTVTCRAHGSYMAQEFPEAPRHRVLVQPKDRGTAGGIFFPAHWIDSQDPEAVVAVFPSDHFILEESAFMSHVANVAAYGPAGVGSASAVRGNGE
jgi:mannose-1-phosphate guanylyltransferase